MVAHIKAWLACDLGGEQRFERNECLANDARLIDEEDLAFRLLHSWLEGPTLVGGNGETGFAAV